ncbi:helix-turn-helix transcriptional regulator [Paenibacillus anseongense]|uniref:helix-turn-helix domain-containing protein n=1 Tax=Paenibacillus anseongense TaxID=2682845 RepID=UPI002DB916E1|nr:helix-turn-helix transcriptional regulator [Paenibacillus anseongense]MEC0269716.1 helix-turn-helix transcriptional regulator [Paenibacillus anseongense]
MKFGERIKDLRKARGITVNQLALYSGISAATISRIETGKRGIPKAQNVQKLAHALKVPYEELMLLAGYMKNINDQETSNRLDKQLHDAISLLPDEKKKFLLEVIKHIYNK